MDTAAVLRETRDFVQLFHRNAELGLRTGGFHVVVVATTDARVDAQEHALAA